MENNFSLVDKLLFISRYIRRLVSHLTFGIFASLCICCLTVVSRLSLHFDNSQANMGQPSFEASNAIIYLTYGAFL
jgi:hypothetical protein